MQSRTAVVATLVYVLLWFLPAYAGRSEECGPHPLGLEQWLSFSAETTCSYRQFLTKQWQASLFFGYLYTGALFPLWLARRERRAEPLRGMGIFVVISLAVGILWLCGITAILALGGMPRWGVGAVLGYLATGLITTAVLVSRDGRATRRVASG